MCACPDRRRVPASPNDWILAVSCRIRCSQTTTFLPVPLYCHGGSATAVAACAAARFERELEVGVPDPAAREDILRVR
jgi:hypothetical protein